LDSSMQKKEKSNITSFRNQHIRSSYRKK
jgi:hypothetical protein